MRTFLSIALLAACGGDKPAADDAPADADADADTDSDTDTDTDTDADTDADTDTDSDADTDTGTSGIPDPYAGLDTLFCDGGAAAPPHNGTYYYIGDVTLDLAASTFSGTETQAWWFSPTYISTCGVPADCVVVWDLQGALVAPGASCATCDHGLDITATLNNALTTCPLWLEPVWGDAVWSEVYDIRLNKDGTAEAFFHASGNPLGSHYWSGDRVTYVAGPECFGFPDYCP